MEPYLDHLIKDLERRFTQMNILGAFNILSPQAVERGDDDFEENLQLLSQKCPTVDGRAALQEWTSFKVHVGQGIFKVSSRSKMLNRNVCFLTSVFLTLFTLCFILLG